MPNPPRLNSLLSQPMVNNNFLAMQSASISVGTVSATSVTFTTIPSTGRITYKFVNTGTKPVYICGSNNAAVVAAVVSSSTPLPSNTLTTSICDCLPASSMPIFLDFKGGVDTISAICALGNTTTLEISIGAGN